MSAEALENLKTEAFALSVGFLSTPDAIRRFLARSKEIASLRRAFAQGALVEETVRRFVSTLMQDLRVGKRLPHELALAALAVALETRPGEFADEFLHDLARLELAELSTCIRVARLCLTHRLYLAHAKSKVFDCRPGNDGVTFAVTLAGWLGSDNKKRTSASQTCTREVKYA